MIHAQAALKKSCKICQWSYKEANLVEEGLGKKVQIQKSQVIYYCRQLEKNIKFYKKKPNIRLVIIKIIYCFSTLLVGFLFDESG